MDLWVQFPSMGIRSACDKALIGGGDIEGVEVGENGLGDSQDQREYPDECRSQYNAGSGG